MNIGGEHMNEYVVVIKVNDVEVRSERTFTSSKNLSGEVLEIRRRLELLGFKEEQIEIYFTEK